MMAFNLTATLPLFLLTGQAQGGADVEIALDGLRSQRGVLHLCLTRDSRHFPDCGNDPAAVKRTIAASTTRLRVGVTPGIYAVSVFHDENSDRTLNTILGIPREGFGFSRNPRVRFGAPSFDSVRIGLNPGFSRLAIRMQYML